MTNAVRVGILVGSESDLPVMAATGEVLDTYGIGWEIGVMSAHRAGDVVRAYALAASDRGLRVLVAGAGAAAHLPGVVASLTKLPVLGVPPAAPHPAGLHSLLSIDQTTARLIAVTPTPATTDTGSARDRAAAYVRRMTTTARACDQREAHP